MTLKALTPVDADGATRVGTVRRVVNHGAGDLIEVEGADKGQLHILPFDKETVPVIDLENRRLQVVARARKLWWRARHERDDVSLPHPGLPRF